MIGGQVLVMPDNPPKYEGKPCECSSRNCSYLLWAGQPVVKTMRGNIVHVQCAVSNHIATWEELHAAWAEVVPTLPKKKSKQVTKKSKKEIEHEEVIVEEAEEKPKKKKRKSKKSKKPKKQPANIAEQILEDAAAADGNATMDGASALEAAMFENAPAKIKKRRGKKKDD